MRDKAPITVCIIDYGMGNLRSVYNKVKDLCTDPVLSSDPADVLRADKLILPGVGHFAQGMKNLEESGLLTAIEKKVVQDGTPILGICLGMQLFTQQSDEGDVKGLGWIDAQTKKFDASKIENPYFKTPHMGWNTLETHAAGPVYEGLSASDELYFCHSYYVDCQDESIITSYCDYGLRFTASVRKDNIHGMQFHPEKSHDAGALLMRNFISLGVEETV